MLRAPLQVCKYCANFFHEDFTKQFEIKQTAAARRKSDMLIDGEHNPDVKSMRFIRTVRVSSGVNAADAGVDPKTGENVANVLHTASAKAHKAMDVIGSKMEENAKVATFEEIKISTEILLGISM
jgi:hypothetical protein